MRLKLENDIDNILQNNIEIWRWKMKQCSENCVHLIFPDQERIVYFEVIVTLHKVFDK